MRKLLTLLLFLSLLNFSFAQSADQEVGITVGAITYQGELTEEPFNAGQINLAIGAQYRYFFSAQFALKGGILIGQITGDDLDYNDRRRAFSMENQLFEIAVQAEWHPLGRKAFEESGNFVRNFSPYLGLGAGLVFSSEEVTASGTLDFKPEQEAGTVFIIPIDVGVRFAVTPNITATLFGGVRLSSSDLLDGISENGNPDTNDQYLTGGIGVSYTW
ncbi:MAG: DUF6089 family protein [Bacteroidota bacterium]